MKLQEYQAKRIFGQFGVPVPQGEVATTPAEARAIAERIGGPVVVKSQVLVGGRGKAGGIKLAKTPAEAEEVAGRILGMDIKGLTVKKVLVDPAADIRKEIYLGIVLDRARRRVAMMASSEGGVDIEEVAARTPEKIITVAVDPCLGLKEYQARDLALGIGLPKEQMRQVRQDLPGPLRLLHGLRRQPGRDQPAGDPGRRHAGGAGRQDGAGRQRALPPPRPGRDAR